MQIYTIKYLGNVRGQQQVAGDKLIGDFLDEVGMDWAGKSIMLAGLAVKGNETFEEKLGNATEAYLSLTAKADNAVQVQTAGDAVVVKTAYTYAQWKKVATYRPQVLVKKVTEEDGTKVPVFSVLFNGTGTIRKNGAIIADCGDQPAYITMLAAPATPEERRKQIIEELGSALMALSEIEDKMPAALAEIAADETAVGNMIV